MKLLNNYSCAVPSPSSAGGECRLITLWQCGDDIQRGGCCFGRIPLATPWQLGMWKQKLTVYPPCRVKVTQVTIFFRVYELTYAITSRFLLAENKMFWSQLKVIHFGFGCSIKIHIKDLRRIMLQIMENRDNNISHNRQAVASTPTYIKPCLIHNILQCFIYIFNLDKNQNLTVKDQI